MSIFAIRDIDTVFISFLSIREKCVLCKTNKYYHDLLWKKIECFHNFHKIKKTIKIPDWIAHQTTLNKAIIFGDLSVCKYYLEKTSKKTINESFELSCQYKNVDIVKLLVSQNINVHRSCDFAFILACNEGNLELVKYLYSLGGFDINMDSQYHQSPLDIALRNKDQELVKWIQSITVFQSSKPITYF